MCVCNIHTYIRTHIHTHTHTRTHTHTHTHTHRVGKTSAAVSRRDALPLRAAALCVLVAQLPLLICAMGNLGGKVRRESLGKTCRAAKLKGLGVLKGLRV